MSRRRVLAVFTALAIAGADNTAWAGDDIEDVELDRLLDVKLEEKLGTTNAVSRTKESVLRAPATITTLDAERIRLAGAQTIPELLRWVPGVQVIRNAPGNWVVSLRGTGGLAGNDLVVLVDGMSMNNPLDGSVQWDLFPVNVADIERIEVVRGPVSPIYGPNAYTGVINIITRDASFSRSSVAIRSNAGVDFNGRGLGNASGHVIESTEKLRAAWYWNIGYDGTNATIGGNRGRAPTQPDWSAMSGAARIAYQLTKTQTLSLELAGANSRRSELDHLAPQGLPYGRSQVLALAKYQVVGLASGHVDFDAWTRLNTQRIHDRSSIRAGFTYQHTRGLREDTGADLTLRLHRITTTAGASGTVEYIDAPYINPASNAEPRFGYGFYWQTTAAPTKSLDLSVAARGDQPPTIGNLEGSYRASAVLHSETTALRLSVGSSYRAPSWVEAAGRFVDPSSGLILLEGAPRIEPPRNDSVELGLVWGPSVSFQLKPTVYASRLTDVVVQDFTPIVRKTFRNDLNERFVLGSELEASWRVRENITLEAWGGLLGFPDAPANVATVGVPSQNSAFTGGVHGRASFLSERIGCGAGVRTFSSRSYAVRAGIPPQIRNVDVPDAVALEAMTEARVLRREPLWTTVRVQSNLPNGIVESPLPNAARLGTVIMFGLEYRRE